MSSTSAPDPADDDLLAVHGSGGLADLRRVPGFAAGLAIGVIVGLGFGLVIPIVPAFARSFGVGVFAASAIISVFAGVRLVSNIVAGPLIDRFGLRRAVGYGALIVGASSLASAAAPTYWWFLVARGLGGFGSALFLGALVTLTLVLAPQELRGRAVGTIQSSFLIGTALGPTIGGALAEPLGLRWPFVIYAGACGVAGAVALTRLPRPSPEDAAAAGARQRGNPFAGFSALLRRREMAAALLMMAGVRWAMSGLRFTMVPLFAEDVLSAGAALIGLGLTVASLAQLLVVLPAGRLIDTRGRRPVGIVAFTTFAVVSASFSLVTGQTAFLMLMGLFGLATGISTPLPAAIVGDVVDAERAGRAVGVLNAAGDLGSVAGPVILGTLVEAAGFPAGFWATGLMLALGALMAVRMHETLPVAGNARRSRQPGH